MLLSRKSNSAEPYRKNKITLGLAPEDYFSKTELTKLRNELTLYDQIRFHTKYKAQFMYYRINRWPQIPFEGTYYRINKTLMTTNNNGEEDCVGFFKCTNSVPGKKSGCNACIRLVTTLVHENNIIAGTAPHDCSLKPFPNGNNTKREEKDPKFSPDEFTIKANDIIGNLVEVYPGLQTKNILGKLKEEWQRLSLDLKDLPETRILSKRIQNTRENNKADPISTMNSFRENDGSEPCFKKSLSNIGKLIFEFII
jgi:hypothetical protein